MSIGASIVLIALGAILRFAVRLRSSFAGASINWHIVGDILMAVGVVGLVISIVWMATLNRRDRYARSAYAGDAYAGDPYAGEAPREPRPTP